MRARSDVTKERVLLTNVLVVAVCALVYELLCGTVASYVLGDAVLQFSLVLGTYLFAMGVGAWMSRKLEAEAASRYVQTEIVLALVGGLSVPVLLLAVGAKVPLRPALYTIAFVVGALVGVELPLLVRILRGRAVDQADRLDQLDPSDLLNQPDQPNQVERPAAPATPRFASTVARALAYDYLGALFASLLFPLVLVPRLGLVRTSVVAGVVNALVALSATFVIEVNRPRLVRAAGTFVLVVLAVAFVRGEAWVAGATD
ncbi:MAG: hypothetical protein KF819_16780 [Labilithrix sp.]|nr:hypothetical protein [Labilithrix sp.]